MKTKLLISVICAIFLFPANSKANNTFVSPVPIFNWYIPVVIYAESYTGKKGVTLRNGECALIDMINADWFHDWGNDWCSVHKGVLYADMVFSWPNPFTGIKISGNYIQGYNEPNLVGQSNTLPLIGAIGWRWIEETYPDRTLISPVFSQPLSPNTCLENKDDCGIEWLREMVASYEFLYGERPRFNAIAVHWYGANVSDLQDYLTQAHQNIVDMGYDRPIWVTEFGSCLTPWRNEFLEQAMTWMDNMPWVERYAWYSSRVPSNECDVNLLSEDGGLTEIGIIYKNHASLSR